MNNISIELAKLDIKVRDYLNVKRYFKSPRFVMEEIGLVQKKFLIFQHALACSKIDKLKSLNKEMC